MPNIILGIDPGIADTGYGVIENTSGKLKCLAYGSIKTKAHETLSSRLLILHQELEKIILKYRPQRVAIEKLFFNKNVKTALIVGQARGVVMLTISKHNLPICEYTPSQIKQAVSSYGQADKKQVQKMVKLILNLEEIPRPDDAADALAAAICALNYNNL
ncbi:MAG: crossover junction endodeoxyribonuclease RuvC [Patescibacteria group bacterium]|nr:crossover junction endodeoxyribonuclease RuvC [Patescibacteria group bacterium]MDD3778323.1 crossover junction endodeoxyribonuclease RuvC [Patescibacteria group bacterium]MDD3939661.1 crossover junction endodeoxyribonuclease RuvC [Patescibacteria group bacterium]NCU39383.1 crossover junction endodeoxyribonuclease RuvC [Candidatus Falkowbacteria bacterium]